MPVSHLKPGSLVLYKTRPAIVAGSADKIDIELAGGEQKRVRPKDIRLLHPGPARLAELHPRDVATEEAWDLLLGEQAGFAEFAELLCGEYSPASAWCAWQVLHDDLYFEGDLDTVSSRPAEQLERLKTEREARRTAEAEQSAFLQRVEDRAVTAADAPRLDEVVRVAHDRGGRSKLLSRFGVESKAEAAHAFLVRCGFWPPTHDPHPQRVGVDLTPPELVVPSLPVEQRRDLTGLQAYAIDDAGNRDPDDAISIDGDRVWVHIADVAALAPPDSPLDVEARARGATLYLPDQTVPMLPPALTEILGLGLDSESPALSIGFRYGEAGITDIEVALTLVRVERLSYEAADARQSEADIARLSAIARSHRERRERDGAVDLPLPEVSVQVVDGEVRIRPLPRLGSRELVAELMLMAGAATGRLLADRGIAAPFVLQAAPESAVVPAGLAGIYGFRRAMRPSQTVLQPGRHAGLGLDQYVRVTSPLRRYPDLIAHQQLRASLGNGEPLNDDGVALRIQAAGPLAGRVRRAERLSNLHWKLVWLRERPDWRGEAVVVAMDDRKATLLLPELALETRIRHNGDMAPDDRLRVQLTGVDLPAQLAHFRVLD